MFGHKKKVLFLLLALALTICFTISLSSSVTASSNTTSRASAYLTSYNSYIYNASLGKIQVYFDVTGVNYMDEIGALTVRIYESTDNENWSWVHTTQYTSQSSMLGYNKIYHSDHVDYKGTIGRYYKAYVTIWAGKDGDGDTRYIWTQPQKATLFAG